MYTERVAPLLLSLFNQHYDRNTFYIRRALSLRLRDKKAFAGTRNLLVLVLVGCLLCRTAPWLINHGRFRKQTPSTRGCVEFVALGPLDLVGPKVCRFLVGFRREKAFDSHAVESCDSALTRYLGVWMRGSLKH